MQGRFLWKCAAVAMALGLLVGGCGSSKKDSKVIKIGALAERPAAMAPTARLF